MIFGGFDFCFCSFFRVFGGFVGFYRVSSVFSWCCFSGILIFGLSKRPFRVFVSYFLGFLSKSKLVVFRGPLEMVVVPIF